MGENQAQLRLHRETLAVAVRSEIERRILAGELQSGEKLNEASLADNLGVSRGTVREAIRSLADSGLIVLVANRGAFVRRLTVDEIRDLYNLRGSIFALACSLLAKRVATGSDPAALADLHDNLKEMRRAHADDDRAAYYDLNIAFHDMVLTKAQNPKAKSIYDALVKEMHLFRRRGLSLSPNIGASIAEHAEIVEAISTGDANAARQAGLHHIESGLARFLKTLSESPAQTPGQNAAQLVGDRAQD